MEPLPHSLQDKVVAELVNAHNFEQMLHQIGGNERQNGPNAMASATMQQHQELVHEYHFWR